MAGIRYSHTATLLPCGEVLVAGGEFGSPLSTAERYNPRTGKWRPTGSLNQARWRHTATLLADGRVLVTGGVGGGPLATAEIYDPATESWTLTVGSMAVGRARHAATLLPNGKVLVTGGVSANTSAQLFDPATGLFTNTGSTAFIHDFQPTLTLLPNGRVLLAGDQLNLRKAELYDPVTGSWTTLPDTLADRWLQAAVLLVDGRVLLAGGSGSTNAEIFDVGRGELAGWRPLLFTASDPLVTGTPLTLAGSALQGLGEGTSGLGYMHSATNYPLVQLRRLDNDRVEWLPVDPGTGWSNTAFRSRPVTGAVPGLAIATVFTNGIPGRSLGLSVECPAPSITMQPLDQTVCVGGSASFSIAATADCPVYQWRKNLANLSDGGALTGTATPSLAINPVGIGESGSYDVTVALSCSSTIATSAAATLTVHPPIGAVDASIAGPANVCTTCLGGIASEAHTGGGAVTHQWGFRTTSGGAITNIPGATSPSYQLSGADFPGPSNYFLVVQVSPDCGPLTISDEVPVTVANGAGAPNEVSYLTVTSRSGKNVLQWVYPAGFSSVRIRFNTGEPCVFPNDATSSGTFLTDEPGTGGAPGAYAHTGAVNGTTYCYTVFVDLGGGVTWSAGRTGSGHPFTTTGPVKWAFQTGLFSTTAPTVGTAAVIATNNGNVVHAMGRGPSGGEWPSGWKPVPLGGAVQNRSPVVPILVGGSNPVVFMGAQDGFVYAVDGSTGGSAAAPWAGGPAALGGRVQAAPAGLFTAYGGAFNYLLVGTREGSADNAFKALDPADGSVLATFDNGGGSSGIGIISGMAAVDMLANPDRVYFTSHARVGGSPNTLWCLELKAAPGVFTLRWARRPRRHRELAGAARRPRARRHAQERRHALLDRRRDRQLGARPHLSPRRRARQGLRVPRPRVAHERRLLRHQHEGVGRERDGHRARRQVRGRHPAAGRGLAFDRPLPHREPLRLRGRRQRRPLPDRHEPARAGGRARLRARRVPAHGRRPVARHGVRARARGHRGGHVLRDRDAGARRGERLRDRLRISAVRPAVHDDSPALHADVRRRGGVRALKPAGLVRRE